MTKSLRGLGYSLETAIADLVDNSIEAGATKIDIDWMHDDEPGPGNWVRIVDNGRSMSAARATEALRYGSEIDENARGPELSAFGFGLKTASTAHCKKVYLAAKESATGRTHIRLLDLDDIDRTDEWVVLEPSKSEAPPDLTAPLRGIKGTVVLWQELDRLLDYQDPHGGQARHGLLLKFEKVRAHLEMVFHRYLSGTTRKGRYEVAISVNGRSLEPWDPFCTTEEEHTSFPEQPCYVPNPAEPGLVPVYLTGHVLPHQSQFSDEEAWKRGKGPTTYLQGQGYYFYRGDRIIQAGGWAGQLGTDAHYTLARMAIEFDRRADDAFNVDIAKGKVKIPSDITSTLNPYRAQLTQTADAVYRKFESSGGGGGGGGGGGRSVTTKSAGRAIKQAAKSVDKESALEDIGAALKKVKPEVADALGW